MGRKGNKNLKSKNREKVEETLLKTANKKPLASKYVAPADSVTYYTFMNVSEEVRCQFITLYSVMDVSPGKVGLTWVLSLIEAGFPGLFAKLSFSGFNPVAFEANEQWETKLFPGVELKLSRLEISSVSHSLIILATLMFAIGKAPTEFNITAFTVKRVNAMMHKFGMNEGSKGVLEESNMPSIVQYQTMYGVFAMRYALKKALLEEVLSWSQEKNNVAMETVWSTLKLLEHSGFNHVVLIQTLMINHFDILTGVPELKQEMEVFVKEYSEYANMDRAGSEYLKLLEGDRCDLLKSSKFPLLMNTARDVAARMVPSLKNYAAGRQGGSFAHLIPDHAKEEEASSSESDEESVQE